MKKRYTVAFLALMATMPALAQEQWDLNKCIAYAKEQSLSIQRSKDDMKTAEVNLNSARNSRLPDVSANASQSLNFGFTQVANGLYSKQNIANSQASINAGLQLYSGNYINHNIKYSDWSLKAAMEDINQKDNDITISVTLAYLQVLYNKEIVKVAQETVKQSKEQVEKTQQLYDNGRAPISDLYESKAQLAKDEYTLTKNESDQQIALLDLAQMLELQSIEGFDVVVPNTDNITVSPDAIAAMSNENFENATTFRPAIKAAEYRIEASQAYINMVKSSYYPTLSLNGSYGSTYYNVLNLPAGASNEGFSSQVKNHAKTAVGLQLNVPIFSRFKNRNQVNLAKIQLDQQQIALTTAKKTLYKEMQQAFYNAMSAQKRFESAQKSQEASNMAYTYAKDKYDAGKSTIFETNEILKRLTNSQSDLAQAKYEYIFRTKLLDYYLGKPIVL